MVFEQMGISKFEYSQAKQKYLLVKVGERRAKEPASLFEMATFRVIHVTMCREKPLF